MRFFITLLGAGFVLLPATGAERPNIVLILADDMGYSDLGCHGGEIRTPNLDRLAAGGVRFTQFYNTARCCPTRASLLTGLYPHQAGIGHMMNDAGTDGYRGDLNRNCVTIAEALKPAGYRCYMAGKWHVTRHIQPEGPKHNWPLQRGFDRFYGIISGGASYYDPFTLTRDNTQISPYADPEYKPGRYYLTDALSDQAVRFLQDHRTAHERHPFFLYVAYTAAHWPMHALPEDIARYKGKYDEGYEPIRKARLARLQQLGLIDARWPMAAQAQSWENVPDKAWEARCMEVYAAMVDRMDQGIGRIVEELRRQGQLDNTLVLYLQDNGGCAEVLGRTPGKQPAGPRADKATLPTVPATDLPKAMIPPQTRDGWPVLMGKKVLPGPADTFIAYGEGWANVSNTPFREYKHWVHEGGIATPLIAHWPTGIAARGELRQQPGHLIDVLPTCLELAGAKYPTDFGGQSITPLEGQSLVAAFANRTTDRTLFWEHEGNRAMRRGSWKLVAKDPTGPWELYDLKSDRTEQKDLAKAQPERVQAMKQKWEAWASRTRTLPWISKPAYVVDPKVIPGTVINYSPASSRQYLGSPSLARLPDGTYVVSHDYFGPGSSRDRTLVFASTDKGTTWTKQTEIVGQWWSTLFWHRDALYLMGTSREYGHCVIRRSTDGGRTWTTPRDGTTGLLLADGKYHCAPVPVLEHAGRLWRAMEDAQGPGGWGTHFRAFMMSAPLDADLLVASNWTSSNRLGRNADWLNGTFHGWLEGNAVLTPDGRIVDVLRVDVKAEREQAAIVSISKDGREATFDPKKDFVDFPGGAKKFTIRFDANSKRYWALANYVPPEFRSNQPARVRNTLALISSKDLRSWDVNRIVLQHPDTARHGYQYVDWLFDGDDLLAVVRTAHDDDRDGAHNQHDSNFVTFHRIRGFRSSP